MSSRPSPPAQADAVRPHWESFELTPGSSVHLLEAKWWESWCKVVGWKGEPDSEAPELGPIDNEGLLSSSSSSSGEAELRRPLAENHDFVFCSPTVWSILHGWYGGGPELKRAVIEVGSTKVVQVELYPLHLHCSLLTADGKGAAKSVFVSRVTPFEQARKQLCGAVGVEGDAALTRLWRLDPSVRGLKYVLIDGGDDGAGADDGDTLETIQDADVFDNHKLVVESKAAASDPWPRDSSAGTGGSGSGGKGGEDSGPRGPRRGRAGLVNIGNTCFMNSVLQCLSNTETFREFFLTNEFIPQINVDNPIGQQGKLAIAFAKWLDEMWTGDEPVVVPAKLKRVIGHFAPSFEGFQQQDSQELLQFLLDGIHEDLNRVTSKPLVEAVEGNGTESTTELAEAAWAGHLLRNNSVVVDLFQGQLKSTVVCPTCDKVSVTVDPFMTLSLPISVGDEPVGLDITFVPADGSNACKSFVEVDTENGTVAELKAALIEAGAVGPISSPADLLILDIYRGYVYSMLPDHRSLSRIRPTDTIFAYEKPFRAAKVHYVPVVHRRPAEKACLQCGKNPCTARCGNCKVAYYCKRACQRAHWKRHKPVCGQPEGAIGGFQRFAYPVVVSVHPTEMSLDEVWASLEVQLARYGVEPSTVANLGSPDCPLTLKAVDKPGLHCCLCDVPECTGCTPTSVAELYNAKALALQWTEEFFLSDYFEFDFSPSPNGSALSLANCFEKFSLPETLTTGNEWYCSSCGEHKLANKAMSVVRLPELLIIHLKRFKSHSLSGFFGRKLNDPVEFTEFVDMEPYLPEEVRQGPAPYRLYAVSVHTGSLHFGHYTAFAVNDDEWINYDDRSFEPVPLETVLDAKRGAYLLFYRRCSVEEMEAAAGTGVAGGGAGDASGVSGVVDSAEPSEGASEIGSGES